MHASERSNLAPVNRYADAGLPLPPLRVLLEAQVGRCSAV